MTVTAKVLIESKYAEAAETIQYTAGAATRTLIDKFTATNVTAVAAVITVRLVPSGGTAGASNAISYLQSIAPGASYAFPEIVGHTLATGDFISTLAVTASSLVIRASGREVV